MERKEQLEKLAKIDRATQEIHRVVVGLDDLIQTLWIAAIADGHVFVKGLPGTAKTLTAKTFAAVIGAKYTRMQFSPDVMPQDVIVGYDIFASPDKKLQGLKKGPIFTQIYLGDEVNRAPQKVTAVHMEPMEEHQITIEGETYPLGDFFLCIFPYNPKEIEGTYGFGEAFAERVMLTPIVPYPSEEELREIMAGGDERKEIKLERIIEVDDILALRKAINKTYLPLKDKNSAALRYIARLVNVLQNDKRTDYGPSPRGGEDFRAAARVLAFMKGDKVVFPEHVKKIARMVLREKINLTGEAVGTKERDEVMNEVIDEILDSTPLL